MDEELHELLEMKKQDEALPEQGFADVLEAEGDTVHRVGIYDDGDWIEYEIPVDDAPIVQRDDLNVMMADIGRRYDRDYDK